MRVLSKYFFQLSFSWSGSRATTTPVTASAPAEVAADAGRAAGVPGDARRRRRDRPPWPVAAAGRRVLELGGGAPSGPAAWGPGRGGRELRS